MQAFIQRERLGTVGIGICIALGVLAIFAELIAPADPLEMQRGQALAAPSPSFLLGADSFGRDILSRLIYGARISLTVGFLATFLGTLTGATIALISSYTGGWLDVLVQRVMDMVMAIPALILAMVMVAVLEPSLMNVVYAVAFAIIPGTNRVIRAQVLTVKERDYILAAQALGATAPRIILKHIVPNCLAPYLIIASAGISSAILAEASLGFLGLGIPAPAPSWGSMLSSARDYVDTAPWIPVFPGLAISLAVFGFNLFGDALRDLLDPRLRGSR